MSTSLMEKLRCHGLPTLSALAWQQFVVGVLEALAAAETELKGKWADFCGLEGAFGIPRKRNPHKGRCVPNEEALSTELTHLMKDYIRGIRDDHVLRRWHVSFETEGRVRSKERTGKNASRTDIRATSLTQDLEFVIEAKNVDSETEVKKRLLGADGLGCFTRRDPYTTQPLAGLVAYTVRDPSDIWLGRIETAYAELPNPARQVERIAIPDVQLQTVVVGVTRDGGEKLIVINLVLRFETK